MMRAKYFLTILFAVVLVSHGYSQCEVLVWSDEFEGTGAPNPAFWTHDTGAGGWGNNEVQTYTTSTSNVRQENGKLIIDALKFGSNWTSGRIKTQGLKTFTYGKIVFRAKLPIGVGTWPALWMLGQNITSVAWPACGEIDVMEHVGKNQGVVQAALHTPSSNGNTVNKGATSVPTVSTEFHDYAVSWNEQRIAFYVDNILYYTYNPSTKNASTWPFTGPQFLIMNIAMGGNFGGPTIDPNLTSARMEVEYVRVYEEKSEPSITGPKFVFENQTSISYTAPDYGGGITYNWTLPETATLVSGQGTRQISVDWGNADGELQLDIDGNTGCSSNSTSVNVTTIIEPTGDKYLAHSFSTSQLTGWTTNGGASVTMQNVSDKLTVNYGLSAMRYIQLELPRAVDLQDYSIVKLPITIPASSVSVPDLLMMFVDGDGNETTAARYELDASKKDGLSRLFSYNFDGTWDLNNPDVNPNYIKYVRIYMFPGTAAFSLGDLYFYNNQTVPATPTGLATEINGSEVTLSWSDLSNATSFHIYRSSTENGTYTRLESNVRADDNPYLIFPTTSINYYKVTGVNSAGESAQSAAVEAIAVVTATENELASVTIFPNPSRGKFTIATPDQRIERVDFYDLQGRVMHFKTDISDQAITVSIDGAIKGTYFLRLLSKNNSKVYKVLIE
ncbi:MAG TPA: family 16 glycosylhydrolase [Cyclobacteriaceae bacterium]|nr:family 16 glycosylhydrolase [Cyclobacteriaceae bacterium]